MSALAQKQSFAALLPVGFHQTDLPGIERLCVNYFPGSSTRPRLMETVSTLHGLVNRSSIPCRLWFSGGFMTENPNPVDFTATLVIVESVYRSLSEEQHQFFDWFRRDSLYDRYRCDNYGLVVDADRSDYEVILRFWLRQCGFDRAGRSEGVAEVLMPVMGRR